MDKLGTSSQEVRRARTRSLIALGGLIVKAGLLETFKIKLGTDLQRDLDMKFPVAGLYKALTVLNEMARSDDVHLPSWGHQGLQLLGESKRKK